MSWIRERRELRHLAKINRQLGKKVDNLEQMNHNQIDTIVRLCAENRELRAALQELAAR